MLKLRPTNLIYFYKQKKKKIDNLPNHKVNLTPIYLTVLLSNLAVVLEKDIEEEDIVLIYFFSSSFFGIQIL
jgi:hypothetical protein